MRIQSRRKSPAIDRLDRRPVQSRTAGTARYRDRIDSAGSIDGDPHLHDPGRTIQHGSSGIIRLHIGYNRRRRDRDPALRTRSLTITLPLSAAFPFVSSLPRRIAFPLPDPLPASDGEAAISVPEAEDEAFVSGKVAG